MKKSKTSLRELLNITPEERAEALFSFQISNWLDERMQKKRMTKSHLVDAIGKRPSEITRWLSGEHNFTISKLSMLGTFFGEPLISVPDFN